MRLDQDLPFSQIIVIEMAVDADLTIQGQLTEACKLLGEQEDCIRRRLKPRHIEHVSDLLLKPLRKFPELLHDLKVCRPLIPEIRFLRLHITVLFCDQGTSVVIQPVLLNKRISVRSAFSVDLRKDPRPAQRPAAVLEHLKRNSF